VSDRLDERKWVRLAKWLRHEDCKAALFEGRYPYTMEEDWTVLGDVLRDAYIAKARRTLAAVNRLNRGDDMTEPEETRSDEAEDQEDVQPAESDAEPPADGTYGEVAQGTYRDLMDGTEGRGV